MQKEGESPMKQTCLQLEGVDSVSSAHNIEKALRILPGVTKAHVDPQTQHADVAYDETRIQPQRLAEVVEHAGYSASVLGENVEHPI